MSISAVHAKSLVAILHLLVALSQYFRAPIRLPDHVSIQVVVVQVRGALSSSCSVVKLTQGFLEKCAWSVWLGGHVCVSLADKEHTCIFPAACASTRKRHEKRKICFPRLSCGSQCLTLTVKWPDYDSKNIWNIIIVGMCLSPRMISWIIIFPIFWCSSHLCRDSNYSWHWMMSCHCLLHSHLC